MDSLKNLGAVFATHYEKIILSVILLVLLGAAALLPLRVSQNQETIRQALTLGERTRKKETKPVDTTAMEKALSRLRAEPHLVLSGEHNVFNPVVWKRVGDGPLFKVVKGDEEGPGGLSVTAIRQLEFAIEFDGVQKSGESTRYKFLVLDESKTGRSTRRQHYLAVGSGSKNDPFVLAKVNGPPENPVSLEIQIRTGDSMTPATITREIPFKRVAGYEADMAHEKLGQRFSNVRTKQSGGIRLGQQTYNIVAITKDEVTVESTARKRWTVHLKGTR